MRAFLKVFTSLEDILQMLEINNINRITIQPINDLEYYIVGTSFHNRNEIIINETAISKSLINDIFNNQELFNLQKDGGVFSKYLIDKNKNRVLRTFEFRSLELRDNNIAISIKKIYSYDEICSLGLSGLNYTDEAIKLINSALKEKNKTIFILGETNTGKTTLSTLMINLLKANGSKIIAVNNNGIKIPDSININLLNIDETLKYNPDVIYLPEGRNEKEFKYLMNLSLKGKITFTSIHSNSIKSTLYYLSKIMSKEELINILNLFIYQNLIPEKCTYCCNENTKNNVCAFCNNSEYKSLLPIYNIFKFDNLNINDDIFDFETLKNQNKLKILSLRDVLHSFYEKGLVYEEDFEKYIGNIL